MSDKSNERRRKELESLALASSRAKLNKVAETLQYDATTIAWAAVKMRSAIRHADYEDTHNVSINKLMSHSQRRNQGPQLLPRTTNMKMAERRFN